MGLLLAQTPDAENPIEWDLQLVKGQLQFVIQDVEDTENYSKLVAQRIRSRIQTLKGEWYQDQNIGVDYRNKVWVRINDENLTRARKEFYSIIIATPGVLSIERLDLAADNRTRTLTVTLEVTTDIKTKINFTIQPRF